MKSLSEILYCNIISALQGASSTKGLPEQDAPITPIEGVTKEEEEEDTQAAYRSCGENENGC